MISHYLALAVPIHGIWSTNDDIGNDNCYSTLYETPAVTSISKKARQMYPSERVLILIGIEFSDDFDPNKSIKYNRLSAWMKCMSISPPTNNLHGMTTTFPISFGFRESSHEVVGTVCTR